MFSRIENNYIQNLANFDVLIAKILTLGKKYKPNTRRIQFEELLTVSQNAKVAIANVEHLNRVYLESFFKLENGFKELKLIGEQLFEDLRQVAELSEAEVYLLVGAAKAPSNLIFCTQRYDFLLNNFCKIIKYLKVNQLSDALDPDWNIRQLETFYLELVKQNSQVKRNQALLCNARLICSEIMYRNRFGMVSLAQMVKMYVKYHWGWNSDIYLELVGLRITKELQYL